MPGLFAESEGAPLSKLHALFEDTLISDQAVSNKLHWLHALVEHSLKPLPR